MCLSSILVLGTLAQVTPAYACSPMTNPWFATQAAIRQENIPHGITIEISSSNLVLNVPDGGALTLVTPRESTEITGTAEITIPFTSLWNYEDLEVYDIPRPDTVQAPAAQTALLRIIQQGKQTDIPVEITYQLYDNYTPWVTRDFIAECQCAMSNSIACRFTPWIVPAGAVLLALFAAVFVIRRRRKAPHT